MTHRLKSCALLLLITTGSARALSNGEAIGLTAIGSVVTVLAIEHWIYPYFSGKSEQANQERIAQEIAAQRVREQARARQIMANTSSLYAQEIAHLAHLNKEDLVTIVTGKYGNRELKFFSYDQDVDKTLCTLESVNVAALEQPEQEKFFTLLTTIRALNTQKNLLLTNEITKQIQQNRELEYKQAKFNAELDNQQKLKEVIRDVHTVVKDQANNRTWTESILTNITSRVKEEGRETRQMVRDEAQRNEHRANRQESKLDRVLDNQRPQGNPHDNRPPAYNPGAF